MIEPIALKQTRLEDLLAGITPDNIHTEGNFGHPVGKEIFFVATSYVPDAGDIVWLEFDPQAGREQAWHRPAWVLNPASYNKEVSFAVWGTLSTKAKSHPLKLK